jgi:multiple sugar transport system substrate-binding protein
MTARLSRRAALKRFGAAAVAAGAAGAFGRPASAAAPTQLQFMTWNYQNDTVQQFINQFEADNPDIKVTMQVIPGNEYIPKIQLMQSSKTPFDVLYVADGILAQWSPWLERLDAYDGASALRKQMLNLAERSMTYQGRLYGLPYFSSYFALMYNDRMLKAAGFAAPPKTYEEWTAQAQAIKSKGLSKTPMLWPVKITGWGGMWVVNTMAASRGGRVLDDSYNITPIAVESLRWWVSTYRQGLSDPNGLELDPNTSAAAFMDGDYATMLTTSFFAGPQWANDKDKSKVYGVTKLGPTPALHKTAGFARLYAMNGASQHKAEAWRFMQYMGGTYKGNFVTPKAWVVSGALTWGYVGVQRDPVVAQSLRSWGADPDQVESNLESAVPMSAVVPFQAVWYSEWEAYANGVLQDMLAGRTSPEQGGSAWSAKAKELAARYR